MANNTAKSRIDRLILEQAEDIFCERLAEILIDQIKASMKREAANKEYEYENETTFTNNA